jgi:hypothetical protein
MRCALALRVFEIDSFDSGFDRGFCRVFFNRYC